MITIAGSACFVEIRQNRHNSVNRRVRRYTCFRDEVIQSLRPEFLNGHGQACHSGGSWAVGRLFLGRYRCTSLLALHKDVFRGHSQYRIIRIPSGFVGLAGQHMARKRLTVRNLNKVQSLFGETNWDGFHGDVHSLSFAATNRDIRSRIREAVQSAPGVYGMLNEQGHLVYVGMSRNLPRRLQSYFSTNRARHKEVRIRRRACCVVWQSLPHELLARIREKQLIRRFRPEFNLMGQPIRMQVGYIVARQHAAQMFELVAELPHEEDEVWGPLPLNQTSRRAVTELNLHHQLRDCSSRTPMQFSDKDHSSLPAPPNCLRLELNSCLAPCHAGCSRLEYKARVDEVKRFLSGQSPNFLDRIEREMVRESQARNFEKAARLRDRRELWQVLSRHLRRLHDWSSTANFVYEVPSAIDAGSLWIVIVRGLVFDVVAAKQPQMQTSPVWERFQNLNLLPTTSRPGDFEAARLVYHWFRKNPAEQQRTISQSELFSDDQVA